MATHRTTGNELEFEGWFKSENFIKTSRRNRRPFWAQTQFRVLSRRPKDKLSVRLVRRICLDI